MTLRQQILRRAAMVGTLTAAFGGRAFAQEKLSRIITPSGPGTSADASARIVAEGLSRVRGSTIIVDNRPGADGRLGGEAFVRTRPGEALLFSVASLVTIIPLMYDNLPFNPDVDMVPITAVHKELMGLFVAPSVPVKTVEEFVAYAKSKPQGSLAYYGAPGTPYLALRAFMREADIDMLFVAYRNYPQALLDLAEGRIAAVIGPVAGTLAATSNGKATLLVTSGRQRSPAAPNVPTAIEAGYPSLTIEGSGGLFGWRGISREQVDLIAGEVHTIFADPGVRQKIIDFGAVPYTTTPAEYAAELKAYKAHWAPLLKEFGAQPPG